MTHWTKNAAMFALLLLVRLPMASAADDPATRDPLTRPDDTFVSLEIEGCANRCPSFEIVVFDTGRIAFRSNNSYTNEKGVVYRNGMRSIYERLEKYLEESGAFSAPADCVNSAIDPTVVTVQSARASQVQEASWSSGCANQVEKARAIGKAFVNQTGTWSLINSDSRYWEKYWETWEYPEK